jgi:hypothetical protein
MQHIKPSFSSFLMCKISNKINSISGKMKTITNCISYLPVPSFEDNSKGAMANQIFAVIFIITNTLHYMDFISNYNFNCRNSLMKHIIRRASCVGHRINNRNIYQFQLYLSILHITLLSH